MNTDQCLTDFKLRLLSLLPQSAAIQTTTRMQLWQCCASTTRDLLNLGTITFFRASDDGKQWQTVMCIHYQVSAFLAHPRYWNNLNEVCTRIHELTGIACVYVRGSDLCHRCHLQNGQWVRESL